MEHIHPHNTEPSPLLNQSSHLSSGFKKKGRDNTGLFYFKILECYLVTVDLIFIETFK